MSLLVALALALVCAACSKRTPAPAPPGSTSASAAPSTSSAVPAVLGKKQLDTPTAFELVASADGATLVWAPADARAGALLAIDLDSAGAPKAKARALVPEANAHGDISDLGAAWVAHELAVAWVERAGASARVRAAWASTGRVFELGGAWVAPRTARGNLVVAARREAALVFARGGEAACIEAGRRGCFGFSFHELRGDQANATGLPLSVPVPCTDNSTALAVVGGRWHYGVCTDTGQRPVTTMFTIQHDPEYARADTLLEGCEPAGTLVWQGAAWLIGECEGRRRAVKLGEDREKATYLELATARLECAAGAARLRAGAFDLPLVEPRGGLQAVLPSELSPGGSRAVWTGRALLVAATLGEELRVTAHTCQGDRVQTVPLESVTRAPAL